MRVSIRQALPKRWKAVIIADFPRAQKRVGICNVALFIHDPPVDPIGGPFFVAASPPLGRGVPCRVEDKYRPSTSHQDAERPGFLGGLEGT